MVFVDWFTVLVFMVFVDWFAISIYGVRWLVYC